MNDPTETRADLEEDLEAAIQAVTGVEGGDLRRGMRLLLGTLYAWREFEKTNGAHVYAGEESPPEAWALKHLCDIRGHAEHAAAIAPGIAAADFYPDDDVFPLDDVFPPLEPYFSSDYDVSALPLKIQSSYEAVRGRRVVPLAQDAARFLRSVAVLP